MLIDCHSFSAMLCCFPTTSFLTYTVASDMHKRPRHGHTYFVTKLQVIDCQLSDDNCQLSDINCKLRGAHCQFNHTSVAIA